MAFKPYGSCSQIIIMASTTAETNCYTVIPQMPWMYSAPFAAMFIALSIFIVVANAVLLSSLYKTNQLTTITNKFMFLMSICDMVTGFLVTPLVAACLLMYYEYRICLMEKTAQFLVSLCLCFSFCMLVAIAVDRYIHVIKLNRYQDFMNDFKMKSIIAFSVVFSIYLAIMGLVYVDVTIPQTINAVGRLFSTVCVFILYYKMSRQIRVHALTIDVQLSNSNNARMQTRQKLSSTKSIRALLGTLLLLSLPYNIITSIRAVVQFGNNSIIETTSLDVAYGFSLLLLLSNAGANALIYGYSNSVNRRHIAGLFKRERRARGEQTS